LVLVAPAVSGKLGLVSRLLSRSPLRRCWSELWQRRDGLTRLARRPWLASVGLALRPTLYRDLQDLARTTPQAAIEGLAAILRFDITPHLPTISAPTLVIVGTRDMTLSPSEGELAARRIPGARLVRLPAMHEPMDDRPDEFDRLLLEFMQETRAC
jgi:pimeloyl-ACP methyl ester carboxylesterase